jgi:hypothetical protein
VIVERDDDVETARLAYALIERAPELSRLAGRGRGERVDEHEVVAVLDRDRRDVVTPPRVEGHPAVEAWCELLTPGKHV